MHVFVVCVGRGREREGVCVCPYVFVSALGSYKMGHHKYSIIIIILSWLGWLGSKWRMDGTNS